MNVQLPVGIWGKDDFILEVEKYAEKERDYIPKDKREQQGGEWENQTAKKMEVQRQTQISV